MIAVLVLLAIYAYGGPARNVPEHLLAPVQLSAALGGVLAIALLGLMFCSRRIPSGSDGWCWA
jgi:hypothetical protein